MTNQVLLKLASAAFLSVGLVACGGSGNDNIFGDGSGGGGGGGRPQDGFFATVSALVATSPDNTEPREIDSIAVTSPEDSEPAALDG